MRQSLFETVLEAPVPAIKVVDLPQQHQGSIYGTAKLDWSCGLVLSVTSIECACGLCRAHCRRLHGPVTEPFAARECDTCAWCPCQF